eukprot:scaffold309246_cov40-Prasinocladus_malaysianus.AAC.1
MDMLETSALPGMTDKEKADMCSVVVVGGGPIGVAVASEIEDFLNQDIPQVYPELQGLPTVTIIHAADHILNVYDERISSFAEKKLRKDKVEVLTGRDVLEVRPGRLLTKDRRNENQQVEEHRFGLCVWTTGLGTAPITRALQSQLGQDQKRRALAVDEFLKVRGDQCIYAMGDCADVKKGPALADAGAALFQQADTDGSGAIDATELRELLSQLQDSHPHVRPLLEGDEVAGLIRKATGGSVEGTLGRAEFQAALARIDLRASSHPSTAQVASQQGAYLAKYLNGSTTEPFKYKHLGAFVQLGGSQAAMQMPGDM